MNIKRSLQNRKFKQPNHVEHANNKMKRNGLKQIRILHQ